MISVVESRLYDNQSEMKLHAEAISRIVLHHNNIPAEKISRLYELVLKRYKAEARVKDFIILLAGRRVEQLLQKWNSRHFKKRND
jgi:hypothetical protein